MRDWLLAIREKKGLSQKAVAEKASISQPSYCNIEKGKRNPDVKSARSIAAVLGFSWTRFYDEEVKE